MQLVPGKLWTASYTGRRLWNVWGTMTFMADPAGLLAKQLRAWNGTQQRSAQDTRGRFKDEVVDEHVRAVEHLSAIRELLDELDSRGTPTGMYRNCWDTWVKSVFVPQGRWDTNGTAPIDNHGILMLEALSNVLAGILPPITPPQIEIVRQYLAAIENALTINDSIPQEMVVHLRHLITHVRWCLNRYEEAGDFDLREAVSRLEAEVVKAAKYSRAPYKWRWLVENVMLPTIISVVAPVASAAGLPMLEG